jgi:predicted RNA-binding Zn ribbon-like protein
VKAPVARLPVPALVFLVNEWGTEPRRVAGETDQPYPSTEFVELLEDLPERYSLPPDNVLQQVADELHRVFAAGSPAERADTLTRLVNTDRFQVHLRSQGSKVTVAIGAGSNGRDALLATALDTLTHHVAARGAESLGICGAESCVDVLVESGTGRPRRYCSTQCSGRARVALHRRRRRTAGAG